MYTSPSVCVSLNVVLGSSIFEKLLEQISSNFFRLYLPKILYLKIKIVMVWPLFTLVYFPNFKLVFPERARQIVVAWEISRATYWQGALYTDIHTYAHYTVFVLQIQGSFEDPQRYEGLHKAAGRLGALQSPWDFVHTYAYFSLIPTDMEVLCEVLWHWEALKIPPLALQISLRFHIHPFTFCFFSTDMGVLCEASRGLRESWGFECFAKSLGRFVPAYVHTNVKPHGFIPTYIHLLVLRESERPYWWAHLNVREIKSGRRTYFGWWTPPPVKTARALSEFYAFQCHQWEPIRNSQLIRKYKEIPVHRENM